MGVHFLIRPLAFCGFVSGEPNRTEPNRTEPNNIPARAQERQAAVEAREAAAAALAAAVAPVPNGVAPLIEMADGEGEEMGAQEQKEGGSASPSTP